MPIPSTNTTSRQRTGSIDLQDQINNKPPMVCADCGGNNECHCDSQSSSCWSSSRKKRSKKSNEFNPTPTNRVSPSSSSPGNTLLNCRKEGEAWVDISNERLPNSRLGGLYPGSKFEGMQRCGSAAYEVSVDIQHVDLKESTLSGYLNIKGLTAEFPELTTFFQAEIIGPKYSFLTRKWQAQQSIDVSHWKRFPSFQPYVEIFNNDDFVYDPYEEDFIYMRWKEHFLVPDHRVSNIDGASFAGFYYICYQRSTNEIKGYYFFRHHTEWFQELTLKHVQQRSFGNFEIR
ncbi:hypothetical protein INT45_010169 [Circinella minor]|uniref:Vacuolar import and degradation protein n=1 Tax=Circinella minor TaxID=1195481 RepID=A0A8H7SE25_9FUNG|nr:hypothetical protein INT45_010169 [Circinella minor]